MRPLQNDVLRRIALGSIVLSVAYHTELLQGKRQSHVGFLRDREE